MASILDSAQRKQDSVIKTTKEESSEDIMISQMHPLVSKIRAYVDEAETSRRPWEAQAINNIKSYRGEDIGAMRSSEEAKVFIRTTTVKTRAAYSQIMEAMSNNSRFPLMIEATPVPEGIAEWATNDPNAGGAETQEDFGLGYAGDGRELAPGATAGNMEWANTKEYEGAGLKEGRDRGAQGQYAQLRPADRAAEQVNKVMQDQLAESKANDHLRKSVFEACLVGSGVMKGIFTEEKVNHIWTEGVYSPQKVLFPKVSHVSIWDLYIDPNALCANDAEWMVERHRFTAKNMRDLKNRAFFRADKIDECIAHGGNYTDKSFENAVRTDEITVNNGRLWEVLEYWGYISKDEAAEFGITVAEDSTSDQVQVNVWICGTEVIRVTANPFLPQRLPYFVFNYEINPYSLYGTGVPETMEDSQKQMNGFARLAVDNLALAGNLVFDVDESLLIPGQDMSLYPGKIFRRQGGQPGQSVHGIKFPSTANENMMMFREFRQLADESTGIPSVSHGQTGVVGVGRTSSGLDTILQNASLNIKTVIRNIDEDLLQPLGTMLFYWNNQFNAKGIPKGDYNVLATGVRSFTKQEIKVQRLQTLMQLSANPAIAPLIRFPQLVRDLVVSMDLNPDNYVNDIEDAKIYAAIIGMAGGIQGAPQGAPQLQGPPQTTGNVEGAGNAGGFNGNVPGVNAPQA